jgi:hypothetical protein
MSAPAGSLVGDKTVPATPASSPAPAASAPARPDFLPEKLWDAEKGTAKADVLAKALETFEQAEARAAKVPKSADEYKLEVPKDFKLPQGMELDANHPLLPAAREFAHKNGLTQEQFSELVTLDARRLESFKAAETARLANEKKALGPEADKRIETLSTWIDKAAPSPEHAQAVKAAMGNAKIVEFVEGLMKQTISGGVESLNAVNQQGRSDGRPANWETMSPVDKRTWTLANGRQMARAS